MPEVNSRKKGWLVFSVQRLLLLAPLLLDLYEAPSWWKEIVTGAMLW